MVADTLSVKIIFFNILTLRKIFKIEKINNIDPGYKLKPFFDLIENYGELYVNLTLCLKMELSFLL